MRFFLSAALLLVAATVHAQSTVRLPATTVRLSAGAGWAGPASVLDTDRHTGPSLALGVEHTLAPNLRGLAELTHWEGSGSNATFATASVELFPVVGTDAYVRAGFGYGSASLHAPIIAVSGDSYSVSGPAIQIGGGYDYRASDAWTVGMFALGTNTISGNAKSKVHHGSGEAALVALGISLTWHP